MERQKLRQGQLWGDVDNTGFSVEPLKYISCLKFLLKLQDVSQCAEAGAAVEMCTGDGVVS